MTLESYEEEILKRMYQHRIIKNHYKAREIVAKKIRWEDIQKQYSIKKDFKKVAQRLKNLGLVTDQGKSMDVLSLTQDGALYAEQIIDGSEPSI